MSATPVNYQVFALKYATVDRLRKDNFLRPVDDAPESLMALDFFVWLIVADGVRILVDTGFSPASALVRKRHYLAHPTALLAQTGHGPAEISDVVVTHLHYDHAGNIADFPESRIWVQEREVQFATGKCMCDPKQSHFFAADEVAALVKRIHQGKVCLVDGSHALCDGVELHRVGGHTDGLQVVRVRTETGWVVLASDAAHYYENLQTENPFPAIFSLEDMLAGYALIRSLAASERHIVPGHDPEVCRRYPAVPTMDRHIFQIA